MRGYLGKLWSHADRIAQLEGALRRIADTTEMAGNGDVDDMPPGFVTEELWCRVRYAARALEQKETP